MLRRSLRFCISLPPGIKKLPSGNLFINGKFVPAVSGETFESINPSTGEKIMDLASADAPDVDIAVKAARETFEGHWKFLDGTKRRDLMLNLAQLIEENCDELAALETLDNGKPLAESKAADLNLVIKCFRYYAGWADKIQGHTCPVDGKCISFTKKEPLGVVGQIVPWNFPLLMAAWKLGPALATGCCSVLKPAEQTPISAMRLAELIKEAGYPDGTVNVLPGFGGTAGLSICKHPDVDKVAFTGSTGVGKLIMKECSDHVKKVTLELGGKSPLIVDKDADLDLAVTMVQKGIFFNQGQVCTASSRLFAHESIHDELVKKLSDAVKGRVQGDPFHSDSVMGPQVSEKQMNTILGFIKQGTDDGAKIACGGKRVDRPGWFVEPTIFTDVTDSNTIAKHEIFGPVLSVLKYKDVNEVVARANRTDYGLAAGIISRDINVCMGVASRLKAGTVWVNTYNSFDTAQPFGGYKQSGIGRELGQDVLEHYTETKTIMIELDQQPVK